MFDFSTRSQQAIRRALVASLASGALAACDEMPTQSQPEATQSEAVASANQKKVQIAFSRSSNTVNPDIYVMSPAGKKMTRLTTDEGIDAQPAWSPDRTRIAFTRLPIAGGSEVYTMNADGTGERLVATGSEQPDWSPDGSRIAVNQNGGIVIMNADGSNPMRVPDPRPFFLASEPDWSPDGTRIAFLSTEGGGGTEEIWVMNADGSAAMPLTTAGQNQQPAWSPNGRRIAFQSERTGGLQVFIMNADGSAQTQLTTVGRNAVPSWSPDGGQIVFSSSRDGNDELYVINPDGSAQIRLTTSPEGESWPAWAP
jgi:TolB protein